MGSMSLTNYEWYGWVVLFLALSSTLAMVVEVVLNAVALHKGATGKRTIEIQTGATALLIVLALWLATP